MVDLPEWAEMFDGRVYVKTGSQAFAVLKYFPDNDAIEVVIEDKDEHRKMMLLMRGMGLR